MTSTSPPVRRASAQPALPPRLPRGLRSLTWLVRALALLGALILGVLPLVFWLSPEFVRAVGPAAAGIGSHPVVIDERALLLGAAVSLPGVLLGLAALAQLWQLFGEYAAGRVFGHRAQQRLRGFAGFMLASALAAPLLRAALGVALTLGNPPGQRLLALSLYWSDYIAILCSAVLLAVAVVMSEAVRLAEENEGFV